MSFTSWTDSLVLNKENCTNVFSKLVVNVNSLILLTMVNTANGNIAF